MASVPASTVPALLRLSALRVGEGALEEVLRIDSELLDVERVSFWAFRDEPASITCELGYIRGQRLLERGAVLTEEACPEYFSEARRVQVLIVEDARADPRLASMSEYVRANGIGALLDVPVFAEGTLRGVLCHEHVGGSRAWSAREAELALNMSQALGALIDGRARTQAMEAERRARFLARVSNALAETLDLDEAHQVAVRQAIPELADMAGLTIVEGDRLQLVAQAHATEEGEALLAEHARTRDKEGRLGFAARALRENQSLLVPIASPAALRAHGLGDVHIELLGRLQLRSAIAVPLHARGEVSGALAFGTTARTYQAEDLRLAEEYAQQVGVLLSNVQLYHRAQDAVRARDEFLSLAAHELRTPLTALTLSADVLVRETPADALPSTRHAVSTVARQTKRLSHLADILLLGSDAERVEAPHALETSDATALVREVAADYAQSAARKRCAIRLGGDEPVMIRGDRAELKLLVSNLLDNALKFGGGRPIDVAVHAHDGAAQLVVRDHGMGISEEQRQRLFRRFERGVSPKHFGGLGLGLHVAARIAKAHGGTIRADSEPGEGAALIVELPRDGGRLSDDATPPRDRASRS